MNRNQHRARENSLNPDLSSAEIERKWRLLKEEQDRQELLEAISNFNKYATASVPIGGGLLYPPEMFVTTWNTTLTSAGSSTANQIKLPLISTGIYSFFVDWGDGTSNIITAYNQTETTHIYLTPNVYTVKIVGTCHGWCFNNAGDKLKLLNVKQWGTSFRPFNNYGTFFGCTNLTLTDVTDVINLAGMTSLQAFFFSCDSLVRVNRINEWNTSGITSMRQVFEYTRNFNDNIGGWDTSNVTDMWNMFAGAFEFNNGGSPSINNWNTSNVTLMRWMFGSDTSVPSRFSKFNQPIGDWDTSKVTNMFCMFYRNPAFNQDIGTKAVTKNGVTYTAWDTSNVTDMSYMFGSTAVSPLIVPAGTFNNGGSDSIKNWNTSKVTLMTAMFSAQRSFNQDIGTKEVTVNGNTYTAWNVENVTNMSFMLNGFDNGATSYGVFNNGGSDSIKNWNTTKVTTLAAFCQRQAFFDQNVGTKVVTIGGNTYVAWNIANVISLSNAFSSSNPTTPGVFNNGGGGDLKNWNTSKVTSLNATFAGQRFFDHDIGTKVATINGVTYTAWDTANVTLMTGTVGCSTGSPGIFNNAGSDSIKNWNTSKVTNISTLFQNQPIFNQPINTQSVTVNGLTYTAWNTSLVTTISSIFGAESLKAFNQDISGWNTANVTNMSYAFRNAVNFNQNISGWSTVKVTDMSSMFYNAQLFNQNLSSWNVSLVSLFDNITNGGFMDLSGLSQSNYDSILNGWASRPVLPNLSVNFGSVKYGTGAAASRSTLTSAPNLWTILDGGPVI